jgi:hypothetical protein
MQKALAEILALPSFPLGGPMLASDLCDFDEDGTPIDDDWGRDAREVIAQCVNFVCTYGSGLAVQNETPLAVETGNSAEIVREIIDNGDGTKSVIWHDYRGYPTR